MDELEIYTWIRENMPKIESDRLKYKLIIELLGDNTLNFNRISKEYLEFLDNKRRLEMKQTKKVGDALLDVMICNKENFFLNMRKAYRALDETNMYNLPCEANFFKCWTNIENE